MSEQKNRTGKLLRTIMVHEYENHVMVECEERTGLPITKNLVTASLRNAAGYLDKNKSNNNFNHGN